MLVDDDEDARLLLRSLLERDGYEIDEVDDGRKATDRLKVDQEYQFVLLGLAMPGLQVLNQIRGSVDTAVLPVIIRTSIGSDALEAGADDYVEN